MVHRLIQLPESESFFLFGPRGTGKTTLIESYFQDHKKTLYINLLDPNVEATYLRDPSQLIQQASDHQYQRIVIDEIQKAPSLLDVVHLLIEKKLKVQFVLTGSSARKLKRSGANLLAGRAFSYSLHPLTATEIGFKNFNLQQALSFGTLPKALQYKNAFKVKFLEAYTQTYLKEEIQLEQIVRKMSSFRQFLDFAGQADTQIINYSKISRQSGVEEKTVARFYEILTDTLVGKFLEPFDESVRRRQRQLPKFYFFDTGVVRSLQNTLHAELLPSTTDFGNLFENFFINECFRLNDYYEKGYQFFYLRSKDDAEIDLIIRNQKREIITVEIKSSITIDEKNLTTFLKLSTDLKAKKMLIACCTPRRKTTATHIQILPWDQALTEIFKP